MAALTIALMPLLAKIGLHLGKVFEKCDVKACSVEHHAHSQQRSCWPGCCPLQDVLRVGFGLL